MKWALVTTIIGYLVWWQFDQIQTYIIPASIIFVLGFSLYVTKGKLEILPTMTEKLKVFSLLVVLSIIMTAILYGIISWNLLPSYYLPPILGGIVLSREIIRWSINFTTKEPKSFGVMSETIRGETVRSKAEKKVADWLYENDYEYEYERKITLPDGSPILSDFYLVESDIYVEYWGLSSADNAVGERYRLRKQEKIEFYNQYGYKLLSIYPHQLYELDRYIPQEIGRLTGTTRGFWRWLISLFGGSSKSEPIPSPNTESETSQLFCTNCGNSVTAIGDFCVKCGTQVD